MVRKRKHRPIRQSAHLIHHIKDIDISRQRQVRLATGAAVRMDGAGVSYVEARVGGVDIETVALGEGVGDAGEVGGIEWEVFGGAEG